MPDDEFAVSASVLRREKNAVCIIKKGDGMNLFYAAQSIQKRDSATTHFPCTTRSNVDDYYIDSRLPLDLQTIFKAYEQFWLYGTLFRSPIFADSKDEDVCISTMSSNRSGWAASWHYSPSGKQYVKMRWAKDHHPSNAIKVAQFGSFEEILHHFINEDKYRSPIWDCTLPLG